MIKLPQLKKKIHSFLTKEDGKMIQSLQLLELIIMVMVTTGTTVLMEVMQAMDDGK